MKNPSARYVALALLFGLALVSAPLASADDIWSTLRLPVPKRVGDRDYLGLPEGDTFTLAQIDARLIVVQVYSMYCPICQREAWKVNDLVTLITNSEKTAGKVKYLAIGAGNTEFEVDFYRTAYNTAYPLFSDGDYRLHKRLGEVRTPYFYMLKRNESGQLRQVYAKAGAFDTPKAFMDVIIKQLE